MPTIDARLGWVYDPSIISTYRSGDRQVFDHKHYVPVLKAKACEFWAIGRLSDVERASMTPLIEIVPQQIRKSKKPAKPQKPKPVAQVIEDAVANLGEAWGIERPVFVDTIHFGIDGNAAATVIKLTFDECRSSNIKAIPVTGLNRSAAIQDQIEGAVKVDRRGVLFRLDVDDFTQPNALNGKLTAMLAKFGIGRPSAHILIDYGAIKSAGQLTQLMCLHIGLIPHVGEWRTISVAASAFPPSLKTDDYPVKEWFTIKRHDWNGWMAAMMDGHELKRRPSFGDYTTRDPSPPSPYGGGSSNIRYASKDYWLAQVGSTVKGGGAKEIFAMCASLIKRPEWRRADFSAGDTEYARRANGPAKKTKTAKAITSGGSSDFVQWSISHHIATVIEQIKKTPGL